MAFLSIGTPEDSTASWSGADADGPAPCVCDVWRGRLYRPSACAVAVSRARPAHPWPTPATDAMGSLPRAAALRVVSTTWACDRRHDSRSHRALSGRRPRYPDEYSSVVSDV